MDKLTKLFIWLKMFLIKEVCLFAVGGFLYVLFEYVWRGYSHGTMFVVGGLCFIVIGLINEILTEKMSLLTQSVIGACIVTVVEFISGYIINIVLKLNVWDYSDLPFNIMGQICLPYTLLWIIVSAIAIVVDDSLRWVYFNEPKVKYSILPNWMKLKKKTK